MGPPPMPFLTAGVFMKATARMDAMQLETDSLRATVVSAQGQIQASRPPPPPRSPPLSCVHRCHLLWWGGFFSFSINGLLATVPLLGESGEH
jgi:hypothetical protein